MPMRTRLSLVSYEVVKQELVPVYRCEVVCIGWQRRPLSHAIAAHADNVTTVVKDSLTEPRPGQGAVAYEGLWLAKMVPYAMGCK